MLPQLGIPLVPQQLTATAGNGNVTFELGSAHIRWWHSLLNYNIYSRIQEW